MEINKNELFSALNKNPEQLTELARQIAVSLGFPPERADILVQNRELIAAKLSRMSESDINNLASSVGEDKMNEILAKIRENGHG